MEEPEAESLTGRVRGSYATLREEGVDAWIEKVAAREFVWDLTPTGLGVFESRDAFREFMDDWVGSYERWSIEDGAIEELSDSVAVIDVTQKGQLPGSAEPIQLRFAQLTVWEGDRVARIVSFPDFETARAAAEKLIAEG
jgi:hypothetical protein